MKGLSRARTAGAVCIAAVSLLLAAALITCIFLPIVANAVTRTTMSWGWDRENYAGTIEYYKRDSASFEEALSVSRELAEEIQAEGTVLLENDGALPLLPEERRISVFGTASVNLSVGGTGSGEGSRGSVVGLYEALSAAGFSVNERLHNFYLEKQREGFRRGKGTDMNGAYFGKQGTREYGYSINEIPRDEYAQVRASYASFSDAALVVIGRSAGEGQDLPDTMSAFYEADDKHYLELTDEEEGLLAEVAAGGFSKVILLLNTHNAFELGFLKDGTYGIDAALWMGGSGAYGATAVAEILTGEREPAGRLPDTYARDLMSSPAMQNFGDNRYTEHGAETTAAYVWYGENIYSGYRYYETRYFDVAADMPRSGAFDYTEEVVYPFGYGLSYTQFDWLGFSLSAEGETVTARVTVKNAGGRTGRETVQLYAYKPYTEYDRDTHVEKAAVELVGYAKTQPIAAGAEETVTIEFPREALASYDTYGHKTYLLEAGTYAVTAARNAHEATENVIARLREDGTASFDEDKLTGGGDARFALTLAIPEDELYDTSSVTGYPVTNRFETERYTSALPVYGLTRDDWTGSWPQVYGEEGSRAGHARMPLDEKTKAQILDRGERAHLGRNDDTVDYVYNKTTRTLEAVEIGTPVTESGAGLNFIDMVDENGVPLSYDDEKWMQLVSCMSAEELYLLCSSGTAQTAPVYSINKKRSVTSDCPMGLYGGTLFPGYPVQAATFDVALAERLGHAIAEEALWMDVRGWYAPALNTHRTPFGGRNYEYYSEDGTLGGLYAAAVVRAAQAHGVYVQLKHFALNDQDTNRGDRGNFCNDDPYNGLCTYANEQTIREVYLKSFRLAVTLGGAHGVMTSYNRIGTTWAGGHHGLVTEVLRNEWGMEGLALTDYAGTFGYEYMNFNQGLRAGGDIWLYPQDAFPRADHTSDAAIYYMQKAAKNILFAEASSSRINGLRASDGSAVRVGVTVYTWQWLTAFCAVLVLGLGGVGVWLLVKPKKEKRQ